MRTTLDIADDVLAAAKDLARADGKTVGQVISELVRTALTTPSDAGAGMSEQGAAYDHGAWPSLPNRQGVVVTIELVERLQEQLDREDAGFEDHSPAPVAPARSEPRRTRRTGR